MKKKLLLLLGIIIVITESYAQTYWDVTGNSISSTDFLGSTNARPLVFKVNNSKSGFIDFDVNTANTAFGYESLLSLSSGIFNTAIGYNALYSNTSGHRNDAFGYTAMYSNTTGNGNSAFGTRALYSNTTGLNNIALGLYSLSQNTTGSYNTASGFALNSNTTGSNNTAYGMRALNANTTVSNLTGLGFNALYSNTSGTENVATGYKALYSNTSGSGNTANGYEALYLNTTGYNNTANGYQALYSNTTGFANTGYGVIALKDNTTGYFNAAYGYGTLAHNTTGRNNTAAGFQSLTQNTTGVENTSTGNDALWTNTTGSYNTANGINSLQVNTTGNYNTALGWYAGPNALALNNSTALGSGAIVNASNKIRLGDASVTVVEGPVVYTVSDGRFKSNISETDIKGLEFINRLRPVVYNFDTRKFQEFLTQDMPEDNRKKYLNKNFSTSTIIRQSGFIAQEVEIVAREIGYDFNGVHVPESKNDNYSIAYSQFVVPLVKAVQELSEQNELLKKEMAELKTLVNSNVNNNAEGSIKLISSTESAKLFQNTPNPFNKSTVIRYTIPATAKNAVISITSLSGIKMKEFDVKNNSKQSVEITGGQLSAGTYVYSLFVNGVMIDSKQMILTNN